MSVLSVGPEKRSPRRRARVKLFFEWRWVALVKASMKWPFVAPITRLGGEC